MVDVVLWLIAAYVIALAAFPLCYFLLPYLRDRGASIAMPFGILTVGYASWILSVLRNRAEHAGDDCALAGRHGPACQRGSLGAIGGRWWSSSFGNGRRWRWDRS